MNVDEFYPTVYVLLDYTKNGSVEALAGSQFTAATNDLLPHGLYLLLLPLRAVKGLFPPN